MPLRVITCAYSANIRNPSLGGRARSRSQDNKLDPKTNLFYHRFGFSGSREEDLDDGRIEMRTAERLNMSAHFFLRPGFAIRPVGTQRIPDVNHGKHAGRARNLFAFQPARVARAIPLFVMTIRNV